MGVSAASSEPPGADPPPAREALRGVRRTAGWDRPGAPPRPPERAVCQLALARFAADGACFWRGLRGVYRLHTAAPIARDHQGYPPRLLTRPLTRRSCPYRKEAPAKNGKMVITL